MKEAQDRRWVVAAFGIGLLMSALIYGANVLAQNKDTDPGQTTCSDKLRQAMNDMHMATHSVVTSGDVDEDFVRLMLPHHQAAIEMAKTELLCGKDLVNRRLAQEIVADQQSEIDLMILWLSKRTSPKSSPHTGHQSEEKTP